MIKSIRPIAAVVGLALVSGCTAGNGALEPSFTSVNLNTNKLQLAVGVATFNDGTTGLNTVATFRQPNGLSATLLNTPTLTGPFTVPTGSEGTRSAATTTAFGLSPCAANVDAGTGHITGSAQALPGTTATCTSFGQGGGVFAYGFAPINSTTAQAPSFILYGDYLDAVNGVPYGQPFYGNPGITSDGIGDSNFDASGACLPGYSCNGYAALRGGPPAYPSVQDGTYPTGFFGYTLGYTTFAAAPVAGAYNLSVNIPSGNNPGATIVAPTATLTNAAGLPPFAAPAAFVEDGTGGGTATCTAPAGVTETIVELFNAKTDSWYTQVVRGGGAVSVAFADGLGPAKKGSAAAPTLNPGNAYEVTCIGADYPLFEAGPPQNTSQTPTLTGGAGQADITFAVPFDSTGYGVAFGGSKARNIIRHRNHTAIRSI